MPNLWLPGISTDTKHSLTNLGVDGYRRLWAGILFIIHVFAFLVSGCRSPVLMLLSFCYLLYEWIVHSYRLIVAIHYFSFNFWVYGIFVSSLDLTPVRLSFLFPSRANSSPIDSNFYPRSRVVLQRFSILIEFFLSICRFYFCFSSVCLAHLHEIHTLHP